MNLIDTLIKPKSDIFIYGLIDPHDNKIKYIGLTVKGLQRIKDHFYNCNVSSKHGFKKNKWISSLKSNNEIFKIIYLQYFDKDSKEIDIAEQNYIKFFKSKGYELLNHEIGGRTVNLDPSEVRKRMTNKNKNKPKPAGFAENAKQRMKHVESVILDDLGNIYYGEQSAAKAIGVTQSTINKALLGLIKTCKGRKLTRIAGGTGKPTIQNPYQKMGRIYKGNDPSTFIVKDEDGNFYKGLAEVAKKFGKSITTIYRILMYEQKQTLSKKIYKVSGGKS